MLVWLLISTALATSFQSAHPAECGAFLAACDADTDCMAIEATTWGTIDFVMGGALAMFPGFPTVPDYEVETMAMATYYMLVGASQTNLHSTEQDISVNYLLSNIYQCECVHTDGCDWKTLSGTIAAIGTCAMDAECVKDWKTVTDETADKFDVEYDADMEALLQFGMLFPKEGQDDKQMCKIGLGVNMMGNAKLGYFFAMATALMTPDADELLETCGKIFMGGVIGMVAGVAVGVMILTIIIAVAYCYCCQNKDN